MLLGEAGGQDETAPFFVSFDSQKRLWEALCGGLKVNIVNQYRLFYI